MLLRFNTEILFVVILGISLVPLCVWWLSHFSCWGVSGVMVQMKLNCHNFFNHAIEIEFHQYVTVMCMFSFCCGL